MSYISNFIESFVHLFSIDFRGEPTVEPAVIGEPRYDECWGEEIPNDKFVVPLFVDGYKSPLMMKFDTPDRGGRVSNKLSNFMYLFDIDSVGRLGDVSGEPVTIKVQADSVTIDPV